MLLTSETPHSIQVIIVHVSITEAAVRMSKNEPVEGIIIVYLLILHLLSISTSDVSLHEVKTELKSCLLQIEGLTKEFEVMKAEMEASSHMMNSMSETVMKFIVAVSK